MAHDDPARPADMRQRILDAATRLFARRGFEGTSLQAIADAVGVRKPSLLYHFDSKDAIRRHVIVALLEHFRDEIPRRLADARDGDDRFTAAVTALVAFFREDPDRARLVLREVLDRPADTRALLIEHLRPWVGLVTDTIALGQQSGHVRADVDPDAYVLQVVVMALGTVASADVAGALLDGDAGTTRGIDEFVRMARTALFTDTVTDTARGPRPRTRPTDSDSDSDTDSDSDSDSDSAHGQRPTDT